MKKLLLILLSLSFGYIQAQDNLEEVNEKLDGAYEKVTLQEREIIPYEHLRQSDIKWSKRVWRVIDFKEKLNTPFVHPKMGLVKLLHDAAKKGEIQVYSQTDKGESFKEPMNVQDVAVIGVTNDTISRINMETGAEEMVPTFNDFNPESVTKMRLKEDWLFDIETSTMVSRIIGMVFVRDKLGENGESQGDQLMYWMYYPDMRKIMAQAPVFNFKNDANTTSWEDVFEMRYFSSYIMKESNAFDRRIADYATGLDLLYESDRIHNEIRDKESDLWEY